MLLVRAFWFGILLYEVQKVSGYYSSSLGGENLRGEYGTLKNNNFLSVYEVVVHVLARWVPI